MSNRSFYGALKVILVVSIVSSLLSCAQTSSTSSARDRSSSSGLAYDVSRAFKPGSISRVVVFPMVGAEGAAVPNDVLSRATSKLIHALSNNTAYSIANLDRPGWEKSADDINRSPAPLSKRAMEFASKYDSQAVMYSEIYKYSESTGSALGANQPAAVGVRFWLVDSRSGQMLWKGTYDDSEKPLSANILEIGSKLKSGFAYRSADDLMGAGVNNVADVLEKFRVAPKA